MNTLFGFSMDSIMRVTLGAFLAVTAVLAVLAIRHRILLALALRNLPRRRAQTLLIVVGLMLSTAIVTSAFTAGDTFSYSIRSSAAANLGAVDETVTQEASSKGDLREIGATGLTFLPAATAGRIRRGLTTPGDMDGVTSVITESVPLQDLTTRQTKATAFVAGVSPSYPAAFGPLVTVGGAPVRLDQLGPNQVYLNNLAAQQLSAHRGDTIRFFVGNRPATATVRAVLRDQGLASGGLAGSMLRAEPEALLPLARLQRLTGHPGQVTAVLISNRGDILGGAALSNQVTRQVRHTLAGAGYSVTPIKQEALNAANQAGTEFTAGLTAFGLFSIAAGITLIFLIFVMLAAERRTEMGVARAIGTKRRHLVEQFIFEGYLYDLGAAAVGIVLGLVIGLGMTSIVAHLFSSGGFFQLQRHIEPRSLVVAFTVGALVTFVTVAVSAWRVSHLNIVAAIRDLPDDIESSLSVGEAFLRPWKDLQRVWLRLRRGKPGSAALALLAVPWHLVTACRVFITRGPLLLLAGYPLVVAGIRGKQDFPFTLGISLLIIGSALLLRWLLAAVGVPDRVRNRLGFSLAGIGLVLFWLLPLDFFRSDLQIGVEMYVLYGIMLALGGAWTVMYNVDIVLGGLLRLVGGISRITPIVKMAVTYPLQHRFRTGMALFMFCLVIVALMVQAVLIGSFSARGLDLNKDIGGYQIYGTISPANPIRDVTAEIAASPTLRHRISSAGGIAALPVDLRQSGQPGGWQAYRADIADDAYLAGTHFTLHSRAAGYASDAQVWQTIRAHPGYAVVDSSILPSKVAPANGRTLLTGIFYEDRTFQPVRIEMRDPRTHTVIPLTVIGVIDPSVGFLDTFGVYTGQRSLLAAHVAVPAPTAYYFRVAPGQSVHRAALALGSAFLAHGLDVTEVQTQYNQVMSLQVGFNNLLEGFVALGLVVGIAALGVIATRSVVERRQQIGMLRAIGFRRRMVQAAFLLESSFVAITGTLIGSVLGLILGHQVIAYIAKTDPSLPFVIPWPQVALIVVGAYAASLLTTYLPAWQASRIYPAEALRYE